MALRSIVRPLAESDIDSAAQWYESERQGLAARFLTDLDRTFTRIQERPIQFPAIADGIRRPLLHTFPYAVYFQAMDQVVAVIAVLHMRRNPNVWRARLRT
jgi:plasmid stabilization system protein ParE